MKYYRALSLISMLCPFIFRLGAVESGTAGATTPETKPGDGAAAPAADAKPKALSVSDFMTKLTAAFTAKETLAKENAEQKKKIEALEKDRDDANTAKAAAESAKTSAEAAKTTAETNLTSANAALGIFATALGFKAEEMAGKSADDVKKALNARVETRSGERLAELGFPVSGLPASAETASAAGTGDALADIQAQLGTEKDPKKAGELAAKANALRDKQWGAAAGKN